MHLGHFKLPQCRDSLETALCVGGEREREREKENKVMLKAVFLVAILYQGIFTNQNMTEKL